MSIIPAEIPHTPVRHPVGKQDLPDFYESLEANLKIAIPLLNGAGQTPHAIYLSNRKL